MLNEFIELIKKSHKACIPSFKNDYRYDLLTFQNSKGLHYAVYQHSKGNKWNFGGWHYYYIHDNKGNFIVSCNGIDSRILTKQRLLKKDIQLLQTFNKININ